MKQKPIIYQLVNRLFGNTNPTSKFNGTIEENGSGKFASVTPKAIKSIKALGCTHIWYTGIIEHATTTDYSAFGIQQDNPNIVKGKAGSPYAIKDYYDVNPDLATDVSQRMKEFESLVKRTHKEEMKVIIDFVPNHVARQYKSDAKPKKTTDFGENDNTAVHFDAQNNFYYIPNESFHPQIHTQFDQLPYTEYPAKATGNDCFSASPSVNDWYETIKLNYGINYTQGNRHEFHPTPDTWKKMKEILLFWAKKGVDGFRCDMAEMVPVDFWGWVIPQVKEKYPNVLFIAEVYNPNEYRNYIFNGKFDYLYDKVGLYDALKTVTKGHVSASVITGCWQSLGGIEQKMLNFLENHDEQRVASDYFAEDPFKAIPALIVSATLNSAPFMLYFGQELGEKGMDYEGFSGRDGRTSIFDYWSPSTLRNWYNDGKCNLSLLTPEQKKLRQIYNKVLLICNDESAIREGEFFDLMYVNYHNSGFNPERQYAFIRKHKKEMLLIVVNFDQQDVSIKVNIPQHAFQFLKIADGTKAEFTDLLSGKKINREFRSSIPFAMQIKAHSGVILKCNFEK
ncbi:MAG: alpha-amylase family glycosyl hydrolase [Bacteroidales bacterium]|nr:alpha-amylase family glycosyl hydrolase [Bacteroidales bacterium]